MNSFEVNKIVGAVLAAMLTLMVISQAANILLPIPGHGHGEHAEPVYVVASAEPAEGEGEGEEDAGPSALALLASAEPDDGQSVARKCQACHSFEQGGANKVGPNLWNVVGADIAAHEGFAYSDALTGLEGEWTFEKLDQYLTDPRGYAPGTKMTFAGVKDTEDRAALLSFLRSLSDSPAPLPEVEAPSEPEQEAANEGGETATDAAPAEDGATASEEAGSEAADAGQDEGQAEATDDAAAAEDDAAAEEPAAEDDSAAEEPAAEDESAAEQPAAGEQSAAAPAGLADLLANADLDNGEKLSKRCAACHTFDQGGAKKIGPNLWNVVGADIAAHDDFAYSDPLAAVEGDWTYDKLDTWLTSAKDMVPGTKMVAPPIKDPQDRADLIAWLRTKSDEPPPLPQ